MGYSTDFTGSLKFERELTAKQIKFINIICGEDCRDHKEWGVAGLTHMDFQLTDDFDGIEWDGSEKTYDFVEKLNLLIDLCNKEFPGFGGYGSGRIEAQGEEGSDRWYIVAEDGKAVRKEYLEVDSEISDEKIRDLLIELDELARNVDKDDYGLPIWSTPNDKTVKEFYNIVRTWLNSLSKE